MYFIYFNGMYSMYFNSMYSMYSMYFMTFTRQNCPGTVAKYHILLMDTYNSLQVNGLGEISK